MDKTDNKYVKQLNIEGETYTYYDLASFEHDQLYRLPVSIRIMLESALRKKDGFVVKDEHIQKILNWGKAEMSEVPFFPSRVLLQDYTGVPAVVDLASMRQAIAKYDGQKVSKVNPVVPVELVIDHSIQVDSYGTKESLRQNEDQEFNRNKERFRLLKWGQKAFDKLKIIPPGSGIVHQVNLENLARVVFDSEGELYPDSVVGTDSHTTMINGLGVLGWGVGGIEAEAVLLGESISMVLPDVVGVKVTGKLQPDCCATDIVLVLTNKLRQEGVVGKFVEFFGHGLDHMSLEDRATLSNMAPEYGATVAFFPVDDNTLKYLRFTGRSEDKISLIEKYLKTNCLYRDPDTESSIDYTKVVNLELDKVRPSLAGPKRPQDLITLDDMKITFLKGLSAKTGFNGFGLSEQSIKKEIKGPNFTLRNGSVLIAAITSCTNTSNPFVLIAAGLMAKKAVEKGLSTPVYVKTSLSPGSKVVTQYLCEAGLQEPLNKLGFALAGYGCMTCIGNSGELRDDIKELVEINKDMVFASVLSGNRNFEGRVHPATKANYLCSPSYVIAYALAGRVDIDFRDEPLGVDEEGRNVFLHDIFPTPEQVYDVINKHIRPEMFVENYNAILEGNENWRSLEVEAEAKLYNFEPSSTYIKNPPYFDRFSSGDKMPAEFKELKCLLLLGDSITTDHISPAGNISKKSAAAQYLFDHGVGGKEFNSYGARRGNHEVMTRGTFANVRIKNLKCPEVEGPYTVMEKGAEPVYVFDAAKEAGFTNLIVIAGKEYGTGSSRDWAAKGPRLLGVKVVIAESYERIHRSNLVGMGILPLQFREGEGAGPLGLTGFETYSMDISGLKVKGNVTVTTSTGIKFETLVRIDTEVEMHYFDTDGILPYVMKKLLTQ